LETTTPAAIKSETAAGGDKNGKIKPDKNQTITTIQATSLH